jgi:LmbE family N-acetylglucosaminyl deacetylase
LTTLRCLALVLSRNCATLSASAKHVHWEWQLGEENPYAARRAEDIAACASLGAAHVHLGYRDAVYRYDARGNPLYVTDFIGGRVQPHDWRTLYFALAAQLRQVCRDARQVYCPLAIGGHVDHVLVRAAAELALPGVLTYYEDYPYAQKISQGNADVSQEVAGLTRGLRVRTIALSAGDIDTRIRVIGAYASQQFALFETADSMPAKVRAYVAEAGGERYYTSRKMRSKMAPRA